MPTYLPETVRKLLENSLLNERAELRVRRAKMESCQRDLEITQRNYLAQRTIISDILKALGQDPLVDPTNPDEASSHEHD